jgi:glucosylceramidase
VPALVVAGCSRDGATPDRAPIEVHVTTGDRTKLLSREPDLRWSDDSLSDSLTIIDVDERTRYQEITGFGASLTDASAWLIQHALNGAQRDSLLRHLFGRDSGIGFSVVRIDMGASDFSRSHYSYDDVPAGQRDASLSRFSIDADRAETIPILRRALEINPRLFLIASPWSAPGWMKTTGTMIGGTLRPDAFDAYAEYFRRFITAYHAEGIEIDAITIQNEPHHEPNDYPGMRLDPAQRARFIGSHLGPMLERARIRTRIFDWDHNWDEPQSPLAVLADSTARRFVSGVAWHCYGGEVAAQSTVRDVHPDKEVWFTECSGGAWAPSFADNLAWTVRNLIIGATRNWARGVLMWNLALDENHGPHLGGCGNCRGVVTIDSRTGRVTRNEEYYAFAHASRFVLPGARRIASTSGRSGVESVAFRNADASIVVILLNTKAGATPIAVRSERRSVQYALPPGAVATLVFPPRAP